MGVGMTEPATEAPPEPPAAQSTEPPPQTDQPEDKTDWKAEARKWETRAKQAKPADYAELQRKAKEHDAAVEAARTDAEKAVEAARREGRDEALKTGNARLIRAEIRALAAALGFRDPHDAVAQFRGELEVTVTDDGVDTDSLKAALTELATAKPYLLHDNKPGAPAPDPGQGARINSPEALSDAEYQKFYPPAKR